MHPTLSATLAAFRPAGPPGAEVRERRRRLADFVRSCEDRVHHAPASERQRMRELLGWDDASLHRFINSPMLVHSSTHVAMNAFAPMLTFPWFCLRLMTRGEAGTDAGGASHLRTLLTHNNLSDNRWKPHVWWRRDTRGRLVRVPLFSKQPRFKHQILLAQPVPAIDPDEPGMTDADREALHLARHATNYAYFAMLYRLALERRAGLHLPHATVEIPLDLMNVHSLDRRSLPLWREAMYDHRLTLRVIGDDLELREADRAEAARLPAPDPHDARTTLICPNYLNLWHSYRLGLSATIGTERMAGYEAAMADTLAPFLDRIGESEPFPQFLGMSKVDLDTVAPLPEGLLAELREAGGRPSFPLYLATHGERLLPALDRMLSDAPRAHADVLTRRLPEPVAP
ncbi:hypothetical protein [Streptomyces sp. NPDC093018]|uniref:hypothetical protein n=1 Tax=Streptomyces sp. NPDC093018 TaxID=3155067 RepID=UPI003446274D